MSIFRMLFGLLDGLIYWAGAELYDLMIAIASAEVFSNTTIQTVAERVYQLLGLIMLFKLIFSFLTYVINPSDMADKTKGFGNIIKKIIIVLCLIVITPTAFDMSRSIQKVIIEDRVIEYFVFGQVKPTNASAGYNLMYIVGKQFVKPYKCQTADCKTGDKDAKEVCGADWDKHLPTFTTSATNGSKVEAITGKIGDCAYGAGDNEKFRQALYDATTLSADGKYDMSALMNSLPQHYVGGFLAGLGTGADWFVEYNIILSTVVGAAIVYMLIIMCLDVALRSVKLAFYEIIAPIPIVTYIGTKDGKDTMLNKWFGEVLKTYADLFTRIAGLQIAIFFIDQLKSDGFENNGLLVNIFLILGALTFAKSLPKILEGMGIKFSGGGFNIKKKLTDDMAGSKLLRRTGAAGLGLAGGVAANAIKKADNLKKRNKDADYQAMMRVKLGQGKIKAWRDYKRNHRDLYGGNLLAGGLSAAARAATSKDGKMFAGAASGIKGAVDARDLRDKRQGADYGLGTRMLDSARTFAGIDTVAKERANAMRDEINELQLKANAAQKKYTDATTAADRDAAMAEYKSLQTKIASTQKNLEKLYEASKK